MLKLAVCDDEPVSIDEIKYYIAKTMEKLQLSYSVEAFESGEKMLERLYEGAISSFDFHGFTHYCSHSRNNKQKNAVQVSPYGISYFPKKSLCVPVRAKVKMRTSPSTQ